MNGAPHGLKSRGKLEHNLTSVGIKLGTTLIEILTNTSVSTSFDVVFETITELIIEEIPFISKAYFYIVDHEIEIIQCLGEVDTSLKFKSGNETSSGVEIIQDFHRGILGMTVQTGKPTSSYSVTSEKTQIDILDKNEISVPIKFENELIGILRIKRQNIQRFTDEDQEKLIFIANALGGFIKSKLLTYQLQRSKTKILEANIALEELNEFQEEIFRSIDEGLILEDENFRILYLNPKAEDELGYTTEELKNKSYATIVSDNSIFKVHTETKKQKNGIRSSYRVELLKKDETTLPVLIHAAPFYREGTFKGVMLAFTNLSPIIKIEEEILKLKEYHQTMLDNLPIGVIGINLDKRIGYINKYLQQLIGTIVLGNHMNDLFLKFFKGLGSTSILQLMEDSFDEKSSFRSNEIPLTIKNKKIIANISFTPLFGYSDEFVGAALVIEDDTAIYTLIDRLKETSKALEDRQDRLIRETQQKTEFQRKLIKRTKELADRQDRLIRETQQKTEFQRELIKRTKSLHQKHTEMESFVYSISHDLKTPIVSIQGYIGALLEDLGSSLSPEISFYIDRIKKNTDYAKRLILDILEYSRLGQDKIAIQSVFSLEIIQSAVNAIESQSGFENFKINIHPEPYPSIKCQPERIHQVFVNLIDNALKYKDNSKDNPHLDIFLEEEEKFWVFVFQDNGIGISDSQRDRIFIMFERGHEYSSEIIEGSGIGLAFSKKIIEIHNGRINVDSQIGSGSTFRVWLPKQPSFQKDRLF
ncbi:MAG: PAS domain-containing protein [Candidatus Heimdallarchaeota archaeon]|nr:MAG: PAS domain-containing protein [Candidatus Heimdallarchaeota archaeon]